MIRSDYLCRRNVTLEYIYLLLFVLEVTLVYGTNFEEKCRSRNTSQYHDSDNNYTYVMEIAGRNYIRFRVKSCNETYIGFYDDNVTDIMYEMVLGRGFCQMNKQIHPPDLENVTVISGKDIGIQNCGGSVFWISYENKMFKLGRSENLSSQSFMEYNDTVPYHNIQRVAIKTLDKGEWCFFVTDDGTQTAERTSSIVDNAVTTDTTTPTIMNTTPNYTNDGADTTESTSSTMYNIVERISPPPQNTNEPINMSMTPNYGPVSGGTEVNITGLYLGSITGLWLGSSQEYPLNFTLMESGNISAVTPEYSGPEPNETGVLLNVTIQLYNVKTVTHIQFKYKRDPHVVDIYPRKMTKSGGLTVTVEGSSLDSVAAPMLTVTAIKRSDQSQRTHNSPCKAESSKQLLCVTPKINTKRKRHTADNRHRRESNDEELDFVLGLQFDGADNYEDLTDNLPHLAHIEVHQDPSFNPGQMFSFDPEFAGAIGIKGENIDAGVVVADYNVSIGKGFCTNIGITSDKLYCNPPLTLDEVTDGNSINTTRAHNKVDITVRVGTNLVYTVGYIVYDIEETISLYTIFVPVVAALGALLVVFVIILIVCCCRKARAKKDSDKTLAPSAQDLNTLEPSRNDNYYTDETQPKNQYYMVVNQGANGQ